MSRVQLASSVVLLLCACAGDRGSASDSTGLGTMGETGDAGETGDPGDDGEIRLDVDDSDPGATGGDGTELCKIVDDYDGVPGDCEDVAPPDSFDPDVQWSFTPDDGNTMVLATPLVANLTDDNDDGVIDLCDTPDVIIAAMHSIGSASQFSSDPSFIYVIDGETGQLHYRIDMPVAKLAQPAVGDIDGDGVVEIIAIIHEGINQFAVFENDGSLKLVSEQAPKFMWDESPSLYDLDGNGTVEIIFGEQVFKADGSLFWYGVEGAHHAGAATTAADLDDDGDLEVVVGHSAFHHDGELYYLNLDVGNGGSGWASGYPQVANFDEDTDPEILVTNEKGISMLEHDGTAKFLMLRPTGDPDVGLNWARPAAVHDFDGDGKAEFALSSGPNLSVYEADGDILWTTVIDDPSGAASATAFDFLGDGTAEAMYGDERNFWAYDGHDGNLLLHETRLSRTQVEYPVVADIDNDGSAEVLVVSNETIQGEDDDEPALKAIRDREDRWIPARRIWNQHAYHVTNVREDGTIPEVPAKHWLELNTFRTQAQISGDGVCKPKPQG